jgi:hypothetical protein
MSDSTMQHVNIKIFAEQAEGLDCTAAIAVFQRWIQAGGLPETLVDVADYSHVPAGPGVLLIGHEANYSLDHARNRAGLLYARKAAGDGEPVRALRQAYDAALNAANRLEAEPEFWSRLRFNPGEIEITLNDRLLHPNTEESWQSVRPAVEAFLDGLFGSGAWQLAREGGPRERLRALARKLD